ncbi:MAG: DUF721 domain-containing protein [Bacteroidetes bacterium]|nr:DUF721 domain-containing protein [Bacteroidota bacterium]
MKPTNDRSIKDAINGMLKEFHLDRKVNEIRLVSSWEKVMGKTVSNRTTNLYVRDKKLFVSLSSASLREELHHSREKIVRLLNEESGSDIIDEIVLQ